MPRPVYPRVCGGTQFLRFSLVSPSGLSPRVRGNPAAPPAVAAHKGSIPACAGEPFGCSDAISAATVYPRVCGGTVVPRFSGVRDGGLSPRVRGNLVARQYPARRRRSIPACAGEPTRPAGRVQLRVVYPRVCGGTVPDMPPVQQGEGLSPRVRGNQTARGLASRPERSIPACAGEPPSAACPSRSRRVYPRVCGGTARHRKTLLMWGGLSPRVRGNRVVLRLLAWRGGSIPACAGEPGPRSSYITRRGVYPRVCGGTMRGRWKMQQFGGLSPRVRGNPQPALFGALSTGSIPACAGEPFPSPATACARGVYPRVCGGTSWPGLKTASKSGLSPRVRGNRIRRMPRRTNARSIPACAGEPESADKRARPYVVYPRVCGGTNHSDSTQEVIWGLSPRVRGNPSQQAPAEMPGRSIPACAGNRLPITCNDPDVWSIPACAGEPRRRGRRGRGRPVYPRVCGGTLPPVSSPYRRQGLSPRVRGNRPAESVNERGGGSIPACAGEPAILLMMASTRSVYPRVCGGTYSNVIPPGSI